MTSEALTVVFPKAKPNKQILIRILQLDWVLRKSKMAEMISVWGFIRRFDSFNKWICMEFHVGKHDPDDVSAWELLNPNADLASSAIEDLGDVSSFIAFVKTCI
jgi:hypothetical protein